HRTRFTANLRRYAVRSVARQAVSGKSSSGGVISGRGDQTNHRRIMRRHPAGNELGIGKFVPPVQVRNSMEKHRTSLVESWLIAGSAGTHLQQDATNFRVLVSLGQPFR